MLREDVCGRETSSIDQMGDATAKFEVQEVELKVLRLRVQEVLVYEAFSYECEALSY